jgi:hypothetical protein
LNNRLASGGDAREQDIEKFHDLLLRVDSRLPDELVAAARLWLAEGLIADVAQAIAFAALTAGVPMTGPDIDLLTQTLRDAGADTSGLGELNRVDTEEIPPHGVAPVGPEVLAEHSANIPYSIDLTGPSPAAEGTDAVDRAAIAAVTELAGADALWRSWRYPPHPRERSLAKRTYLVRMSTDGQAYSRSGPHRVGHHQLWPDGEGLAEATAHIQARLVEAGETDPLVRVFTVDAVLPGRYRAALEFAALLWTAQRTPPIHIARHSADRHPEVRIGLDHQERDRVVAYLSRGAPLLITLALSDDVMDPALAGIVPMNFRTDGEWIWSDAIAYYLDRYGLAPDDAFLEHIRQRRYMSTEVDEITLHRALSALQVPRLLDDSGPSSRFARHQGS